jgi:hypothetical protein
MRRGLDQTRDIDAWFNRIEHLAVRIFLLAALVRELFIGLK